MQPIGQHSPSITYASESPSPFGRGSWCGFLKSIGCWADTMTMAVPRISSISAQDAGLDSTLTQLAQRRGNFDVFERAGQVKIEAVFPWPPFHGPTLNL